METRILVLCLLSATLRAVRGDILPRGFNVSRVAALTERKMREYRESAGLPQLQTHPASNWLAQRSFEDWVDPNVTTSYYSYYTTVRDDYTYPEDVTVNGISYSFSSIHMNYMPNEEYVADGMIGDFGDWWFADDEDVKYYSCFVQNETYGVVYVNEDDDNYWEHDIFFAHALIRVEPTCVDDWQNQGESDVDCGGDTDCPRCDLDQLCTKDSDCSSGHCDRVCISTATVVLAAAGDGAVGVAMASAAVSNVGGAGGAASSGSGGGGGASGAAGLSMMVVLDQLQFIAMTSQLGVYVSAPFNAFAKEFALASMAIPIVGGSGDNNPEPTDRKGRIGFSMEEPLYSIVSLLAIVAAGLAVLHVLGFYIGKHTDKVPLLRNKDRLIREYSDALMTILNVAYFFLLVAIFLEYTDGNQAAAISFLIIIGIPFPMMGVYLSRRKTTLPPRFPTGRTYFASVKPEYQHWFFLVRAARKATAAALLVFMFEYPAWQITALLATQALYVILVVRVKPFESELRYRIELFLYGARTIVLFLILACHENVPLDEPYRDVMGYLLIVAQLSVIIAILVKQSRSVFAGLLRRCGWQDKLPSFSKGTSVWKRSKHVELSDAHITPSESYTPRKPPPIPPSHGAV